MTMNLRIEHRLAALAVGLLAAAAPAAAQHEHGTSSGEALGKVEFRTSCSPAVRDAFNRSVALLHSFEFRSAIEAFGDVLQKDSSCAMAQWGIAMSQWSNPYAGLRAPGIVERGQAAIDRARAIGTADARERAYIDAAAELYKDAATVPQRERTLAYERAMEALSRSYPDDIEARIFYALAVGQNALATDKTYANQIKAAGILEPLFRDNPEHPGLAHYIIHSYDHPPLAPRAVDAARRYAKIAPAAPHALHMPSHTFTRVGYWTDSIASNIASAETAAKRGDWGEVLHAMDYQTYAYLQRAQDKAARRVFDRVPDVRAKFNPDRIGGAAPGSAGIYATAAIPARYALERGAWADAAALTPQQTAFPWADAVTHFARALGAARSGAAPAVRVEIDRLKAISEKLAAAKDTFWQGHVDIQRRAAEAWALFAEGRRDEAIAAMREAADAEDATDKAPISPGPLAPARELLGEMLLEAGRHQDALAAFEATMKKEPNRFRAVAGAMRAAEAAGDRPTAATHARELLEIAKEADGDRPDLGRARQLTGKT
jgi:hypothetical protein